MLFGLMKTEGTILELVHAARQLHAGSVFASIAVMVDRVMPDTSSRVSMIVFPGM